MSLERVVVFLEETCFPFQQDGRFFRDNSKTILLLLRKALCPQLFSPIYYSSSYSDLRESRKKFSDVSFLIDINLPAQHEFFKLKDFWKCRLYDENKNILFEPIQIVESEKTIKREETFDNPYFIWRFFIDSLSQESSEPKIAKDVFVEEGATISGKVVVKSGAKILRNAIVKGPAFIGENVIVGNGALVRESFIDEESVVGFNTEIARSYLGRGSTFVVRWRRDQKYYDDNWHGNLAKSGGGALMTQAIHHVDLLCYLFGCPQSVFGSLTTLRFKTEVEDCFVGILEYQSGLRVTLESSTLVYPKNLEASLTLLAEKGTLKIGGLSANQTEFFYSEGNSQLAEEKEASTSGVYGTNHFSLIKDFLETVSQDREPLVTGEQALQTQKIIEALYLSARLGKKVNL